MILGNKVLEAFKDLKGYSRYQISESGKLFDKKIRRFINPVAKKGYFALSLVDDNGVRKNYSRHRLVAMAFLANDDELNKTHVNHKNGITGEDHYLNLEWCTPSYNRQHAIDNGLAAVNKDVLVIDDCGEERLFASIRAVARELGIPYNRLKRLLQYEHLVVIGQNTIKLLNSQGNNGKTKVVWRNLISRQAGEFPSIAAAAKETGVSIHSIHNRLALPQYILHKDGFQFARKREFTGWMNCEDFDKEFLENSWSKCVLLRWLNTGEEIEFDTQTDAALFLGLSLAKISISLDRDKQPIVMLNNRFALLKRKSDPSDWREVKDPLIEYSRSRGLKPVVVTNVIDGSERIYVSANQCSSAMGIGTTTLNWRLKKPNAIYDNYSFKYLDCMAPST